MRLLFFFINFGRCEINIKVLQHTGSNGVFANPNAEIRFDPSLFNQLINYLDGVGPDDNIPSPDQIHHFVKEKEENKERKNNNNNNT